MTNGVLIVLAEIYVLLCTTVCHKYHSLPKHDNT